MKKIIGVLILVCAFCLSSCGGMAFESEFIRADMFFLLEDKAESHLFYERDDVDEFLSNVRDNLEIEDYNEWFFDRFDKFDEEFFSLNALALVAIIESSGSTTHKVKSVNTIDDALVIDIERKSPRIGTCDMAYWYLFLSFSKNDCNKTQIKIV